MLVLLQLPPLSQLHQNIYACRLAACIISNQQVFARDTQWDRHRAGHEACASSSSALLFHLLAHLASVLLVYIRSPLVSEMLGNAQLLCEKGGVSVSPLSLHTGGALFVDVCVRMHVSRFWQRAPHSHTGRRVISGRAHLLLCHQFSWTTKLVQICSRLYLDWLRGSGVGEAICRWWSTGALSCTVSTGSTGWSTSFTVGEVCTDWTRLPQQTRTSSHWITLQDIG